LLIFYGTLKIVELGHSYVRITQSSVACAAYIKMRRQIDLQYREQDLFLAEILLLANKPENHQLFGFCSARVYVWIFIPFKL
jgi:hypothetical protein